MNYIKEYNKWIKSETNEELLTVLKSLNEETKKDSFASYLSFGTAGMRGMLGPGINRMNIHTVAWVTKGFANALNDVYKKPTVVIGYDVRHMSKEFADVAASVLASSGIKVHLFPNISPTPLVSYAVRKLKASAGIMITASHNPKEYNGYKVYNSDGAQIVGDFADKITKELENLYPLDIKINDVNKYINNSVFYVNEKLLHDYKEKVNKVSFNNIKNKDVSIVFTPLNGTGILVEEVLKERGFNNVLVVPEERNPDPNFTTTSVPNPENPEVFKLAEKLGKQNNSKILLATDPDADRIGMKILENGEYTFLTGNEIGLLLTNYILSANEYENGAIIKTIVTSKLVDKIAKDNNVAVYDVLVGFKNIYELVKEWEETGERNFILGFEESFGFGLSKFVRDKDAVLTAGVIAEMVAYYKEQNKSLIEIMTEIYEKYGYVEERMFSINLGNEKSLVDKVMTSFRNNPIKRIKDIIYIETVDYLNDDTGLPRDNSIVCKYSKDNWFAIRPSGTEPKLKFYVYGYGENKKQASENANVIENSIRQSIENMK